MDHSFGQYDCEDQYNKSNNIYYHYNNNNNSHKPQRKKCYICGKEDYHCNKYSDDE